MIRQSRRRFLTATAAATTGALAGCLGGASPGGQSQPDAVQASFFVLYDFVSHVAGETTTVENLVPFGQHGHGWEPGPDIQRRVFDAAAFVYMGEGFQPWADDIARNLQADDAGVPIIEARHGIDLLDASDSHDGEDTHDEDHDGEGEHDGEDTHDEAHDGEGEHDGENTHDEEGHDGEETHSEGEDHDHAGADPHFWLDPELATQAVDNIAHGLGEIDSANQDAFEENAAAFVDRLTAVDETYRERLSTRTKDTVLVAGHDSFQYLARRYDFHVEALTGIAPDAEPTPRDVRRAQEAIEEHDIEYVLAPVFESDRAARQLVAETDAVDVLPLTPVPSLTEEWADEGWDYLDVVERVNLPSLAAALGAE